MKSFVRGDTFPFKIRILADSNTQRALTKEEIETIFVTCKADSTFDSPELFKKDIDDVVLDTEGYCHIVFEPQDTENLSYGVYAFDIEVTLKNGYRKTYYNTFEITDETTTHGGDK